MRKEQLNYIVIKFWKNRKNKDDFIFVTGTQSEVRQQLIDLMRASNNNNSNKPSYGDYISNKGKPKVVLYFLEKQEDVEDGYLPIESRISFRLNNLSEKWDNPGFQNLTLTDIEQLALRINNEFCTPTPYKFKKGKTTVSYRDKKRGIESYSYFYTKADGVALYQKICNVAQIQYEGKYCKVTETEDTAVAYPTVPPSQNVLGETVKSERIRPVGDVIFNYALLFCSSFKKPVIVASAANGVFTASKFNVKNYI
jgi:hypothetical protein